MINLNKITKNGKALYLAYDHGLEHGPADFEEFKGELKVPRVPPEGAIDPEFVLQIAKKNDYNGVILQKGIAEKYFDKKKYKNLPLIVKLNGKTQLVSGDPVSAQVCSVKEAKLLGASAIGYTIYPGSKHEAKMFAEFGQIVEEAHQFKMPAIAWIYPSKTTPKTIAYAARIGLELGADIVKIKYPGSKEAFAKAVKAAGKTKVMMAGGPKAKEKEFLKTVKEAMQAGAIGIVVGRNVWQNKNPLKITKEIKKIIWPQ